LTLVAAEGPGITNSGAGLNLAGGGGGPIAPGHGGDLSQLGGLSPDHSPPPPPPPKVTLSGMLLSGSDVPDAETTVPPNAVTTVRVAMALKKEK
jgi:hypothetical protein